MTTLGSPWLFGSFLFMAACLCALFLVQLRRLVNTGALTLATLQKCALGLLTWVVSWGVVGASGVLDAWDSMPPRMMIAMPALFGVTLAVSLSPLGGVLAKHSSYAALIGVQAFRLPLELMMYRAAVEGIMPEQMSFAGYNYDVATGLVALAVLVYSRGKPVPHWLAWAFNLLGTCLLAVILAIAVASIPTFSAFGPERTNTWVTHFPYIYLPAIMVQVALLAHVLTFRKLVSSSKSPVKEKHGTAQGRFRASGT